MTMVTEKESQGLHDRAYAAMDRGELHAASRDFERLLSSTPNVSYYHYMLGLAHKYLRDWRRSLHHNRRAIDLTTEDDREAEYWNAAIAATGLGDWKQARELWTACGVNIPEGTGPIDADFGLAVVRLNPWAGGETVFMRRIDPVRARLLNVPLPESGHRFGDIVLHDGAPTGHRYDGNRVEVPVFNELQRLVPSDFQTFVVFVGCETPADLEALLSASAPGIGFSEDWTSSISHLCMRCSYGTPHRHADADAVEWETDRNLGIAAQSRHSVDKLLAGWSTAAGGRRIDAVETRECAISEPTDGHVWWRGPDDDEDNG